MTKEHLYLIALVLFVLGIAILLWRDRKGYICSQCGKRTLLISGSNDQRSWCDECHEVTRFVRE